MDNQQYNNFQPTAPNPAPTPGNFAVNNQNFNQPLQSDQAFSLSQVPTNQALPQNPNQPDATTPNVRDSGKSNISKETRPKPTNPNSTQNHLQIAEVREGIIIMKDGSFKTIISCKSINFDLMSAREREGIEYGYQGFLNSLYFPIQILIRSNKVDIGPYLEKLVNIRSKQDNMLLNVLIDDYINYIDILAQEANIMDKTFYVVIPYYPTNESFDDIKSQSKGILGSLFAKNPNQTVKVNQKAYLKAKEEIQNRVDVILNGLNQVGVQAKQLNTEQISQLFYNFYNPDTANREPLVSFDQISTIYTTKGTNPPGGDI